MERLIITESACHSGLPTLLRICSIIIATIVATIKGKNIKSRKDIKIISVCITFFNYVGIVSYFLE